MKNFIDFVQEGFLPNAAPWLVLGKGPSFSKHKDFALSAYHTLSLNHAVRELSVDVAHIIDIEVVENLADILEKNARFVVMPWHPHHNFQPSNKTLTQWQEDYPVLKRLDKADRLLWYDLSTTKEQKGRHKPIKVTNFSSEAALRLLAQAGAKKLFTLGLDGGRQYAPAFSDLESETKLANGQLCFNSQFKQFPSIINEYQLTLAPLDQESPITIFIGASQREWLPARVLEFSIKKHSSMSVACRYFYEADIPVPRPKQPNCQPRTPFSFQRFLIPQLKGFSGKAIYLDSDMLVTGDISQLWQLPFKGSDLLHVAANNDYQRQSQFAVMLLDCEKLNWQISKLVKALDDGTLTYGDLMHEMKVAQNPKPGIAGHWNSLDRYEPDSTSLVHYTDMKQQPWLSRHNPAEALWISNLREAILQEFITLDQIAEQIQKGNVRPSLMLQLQLNLDEGILLGEEGIKLDLDFVPPYSEKEPLLPTFKRLKEKLAVFLRSRDH